MDCYNQQGGGEIEGDSRPIFKSFGSFACAVEEGKW